MFIPAADEVGHLQSGKDAECRLFQKIAEQGHYAGRTKPTSTRQGTYATTAGGTLLASWNNNDPRFVARKLREALAKWERLKAEGRQTAGESGLEAASLNRSRSILSRKWPRAAGQHARPAARSAAGGPLGQSLEPGFRLVHAGRGVPIPAQGPQAGPGTQRPPAACRAAHPLPSAG